MKKILVSILLLLFLFSCSKYSDIEEAYKSGDFENALKASQLILDNTLEEEALFWKTMSSWSLSRYDDEASSAELYLMLYPEEEKEHYILMLRAVLLLSKDKDKALKAGKELYYNHGLYKAGATKLYTLLVERNDPLQSKILAFLRPLLTATEYAFLMIDSESSSDSIILALEAMYEEQKDSVLYSDALNDAVFLLSERGEGEKIVQLALATATDDPELSITIGDLLYSLGDYRQATEYWEKGREISPEGYRIRMRLLSH